MKNDVGAVAQQTPHNFTFVAYTPSGIEMAFAEIDPVFMPMPSLEAGQWDMEIASDVAEGRLDRFLEEARSAEDSDNLIEM